MESVRRIAKRARRKAGADKDDYSLEILEIAPGFYQVVETWDEEGGSAIALDLSGWKWIVQRIERSEQQA